MPYGLGFWRRIGQSTSSQLHLLDAGSTLMSIACEPTPQDRHIDTLCQFHAHNKISKRHFCSDILGLSWIVERDIICPYEVWEPGSRSDRRQRILVRDWNGCKKRQSNAVLRNATDER